MILVGGTGRSGTSILKEVIASHSDAASLPFEYRFIIDPDGLIDFYASFTATWSPYLADRRLKRLESLLNNLGREPLHHKILGRLLRWLNRDGKMLSPRAYHGWELNHHLPHWDQHVQTLMSELVEFSFPACWVGTESYQFSPEVYHSASRSRQELARILGGFVQDVIDDLLDRTGKEFFIEDNTWNVLFAREIIELLPEAKIIHIHRDPRDVVASFSRQRWCPADKEQGARWYRAMMAHWFNVRSDLPIGTYYEVGLEELVAAPEAVLREVCEFAEISFDRAMLQVDLGDSHSGRWEAEFSDAEKGVVHEILGDIISELGY